MFVRTRYAKLPVSVKLLSPPLILFLTLWTAGTLGVGFFARSNLEQTARKETIDLAILVQQDLQQKQNLLRLKTRWVSEESNVIKAIAASDRPRLLRTLLPIQAALELDLIKVVNPTGQTVLLSQQRSLEQAKLQDGTILATAQTGLELSGILLADNAAPSALVSLISIKSATQILATLILGVGIDDQFLQDIRGNSSMHLVALQRDRVTASTLPLDRHQPLPIPQVDALPIRITIADHPYLFKTIEVSGFGQTTLKIAVLKSIIQTEQAEQRLWWVVGGFGLLGGALVVGVMLLGLRVTQALSRRIQRLTQVTQQLAQGDLTIRIPVNHQDEVGSLAQGFNTMAEQLTTRDQHLQQNLHRLQNTLEELHRTQSQMVQSEKMSALGQLVAGVAHEINNPVNFIHGNLTFVEQYTQDLLHILASYQHHYPQPPAALQADLDAVDLDFLTKDIANIVQSMQVGSERIREIVLSLRNFSRLDESEFKAVDIHEGIDNTLLILRHRLQATAKRPAIQVNKQYGDLPKVECYAGQLNQVFMNLLGNAIDALEDSNQHRTFQDIEHNPNSIWIHTEIGDRNQVKITIADNGKGIAEAVSSRLFEPFFTTKPVGKGTGLGLSISYQIIIEKHKGKLYCDSTPGAGTKFMIEIPIQQQYLV
ncbi:two-component sensor histidine kinase [Leptolyngbya sp. 'hensonii']|uniref:ATP-binding protein n=1 Tax=Leptolyngbya sp. 'hensonii' TaxID=1922337 RepID=UPI00094F8D1E|nr:ATP-binding protein [Leptolyngbya sp. 'hensonii']OLP18888.1 two-component sensor histidine kinase [Leptolyngbya sp. 'hensonii']